MQMIDWIDKWLQTEDTKLIYFLVVILIANILDVLMGWVNAKFNVDVDFSSSKALLGIIKKIIFFMLLVYFIPVALILPDGVGLGALYILYGAYWLSEMNSVLAHLKLTDDKKQTEMFIDFIQKLFKGENTNE